MDRSDQSPIEGEILKLPHNEGLFDAIQARGGIIQLHSPQPGAQPSINRPSSCVLLKEVPIFKDNISFEFLRPDNFTECPFCKREENIIIGTGSKLKLISPKVRTSRFQAKFIKVKVLENKKHKVVNNAIYAKPGDTGWILLSLTDYHYYYNPEFNLITDR